MIVRVAAAASRRPNLGIVHGAAAFLRGSLHKKSLPSLTAVVARVSCDDNLLDPPRSSTKQKLILSYHTTSRLYKATTSTSNRPDLQSKVDVMVAHNFPDFIERWNRHTFRKVGYGSSRWPPAATCRSRSTRPSPRPSRRRPPRARAPNTSPALVAGLVACGARAPGCVRAGPDIDARSPLSQDGGSATPWRNRHTQRT